MTKLGLKKFSSLCPSEEFIRAPSRLHLLLPLQIFVALFQSQTHAPITPRLGLCVVKCVAFIGLEYHLTLHFGDLDFVSNTNASTYQPKTWIGIILLYCALISTFSHRSSVPDTQTTNFP